MGRIAIIKTEGTIYMRVVEAWVLDVLRGEARPGRRGNTRVELEGDEVVVRLHDNAILRAPASRATNGTLFVRLSALEFSMAGWPTVTTRSRLNAILQTVFMAYLYSDRGRQILLRNEYGFAYRTPVDIHAWVPCACPPNFIQSRLRLLRD